MTAEHAGRDDATPEDAAVADNADLIAPGGKVDREKLYELYESGEADDDTPVSVSFTLSRDLNKRLDRYLVDRIPFLSRTSLQRLIKEEAVTVNGRPPKASTKLRLGDTVTAVLPPPPSSEIPAEDIPLSILYEDEHLIVINKDPDIIVHPARGNKTGTIINALAWHFQHRSSGALSTVGEEFARPGVVHRLDRFTTGVMVAAKSDVAHWRLGKQFEKRTTDKRYLALVHGRMETATDAIDFPLGKHPTKRELYAVRWDETGKECLTIYRVREVYDQYSLVELELKTGRTHQIRVHLSHIGYPIVGDDYYGGRHVQWRDVAPGNVIPGSPRDLVINRQALHATLLTFTHPMTDERMTFQAPLRPDMLTMIGLLRTHQNPKRVNTVGATVDLEQVVPTES